MNLAFTDEQIAAQSLARDIFAGHCTDERLREIEAGSERYDPALWAELGRSGLLGIGAPETDGGSGGGIIEVCLVLEEAGRATAPVPLHAALTAGALPLARFATDEQRARLLRPFVSGDAPVIGAIGRGRVTLQDGTVSGRLDLVPVADKAARLIVETDQPSLALVDPNGPGVTLAPQDTTVGEPAHEVTLDGAPAEVLAHGTGAVAWAQQRALVGLCALQVGACDAALRLTASYTSERRQFDKPLGSFQAVQQRAGDAYIDLEAMRWTTLRAAWLLSEERPAAAEVAVAKFWASDGGARIIQACQHLHGGMGVDMDYPLHRSTLLGRRIELALGGGEEQLARLGTLIAQGADA